MTRLTEDLLTKVNAGDPMAIALAVTTRLPLLRCLSHRYGSDDLVNQLWLSARQLLAEAIKSGNTFDSVGRLGSYLNQTCKMKASTLKHKDTISPAPHRKDIYQVNMEFTDKEHTPGLNEILEQVTWPLGQSIVLHLYKGLTPNKICTLLNLSRRQFRNQLDQIRKVLNGSS